MSELAPTPSNRRPVPPHMVGYAEGIVAMVIWESVAFAAASHSPLPWLNMAAIMFVGGVPLLVAGVGSAYGRKWFGSASLRTQLVAAVVAIAASVTTGLLLFGAGTAGLLAITLGVATLNPVFRNLFGAGITYPWRKRRLQALLAAPSTPAAIEAAPKKRRPSPRPHRADQV